MDSRLEGFPSSAALGWHHSLSSSTHHPQYFSLNGHASIHALERLFLKTYKTKIVKALKNVRRVKDQARMKTRNRSLPRVLEEVQGFGYQQQHSLQRLLVSERQQQPEDLVEQAEKEEDFEGLLVDLLGLFVPWLATRVELADVRPWRGVREKQLRQQTSNVVG